MSAVRRAQSALLGLRVVAPPPLNTDHTLWSAEVRVTPSKVCVVIWFVWYTGFIFSLNILYLSLISVQLCVSAQVNKRVGARTEPWGTPQIKASTANCDLFVMFDTKISQIFCPTVWRTDMNREELQQSLRQIQRRKLHLTVDGQKIVLKILMMFRSKLYHSNIHYNQSSIYRNI